MARTAVFTVTHNGIVIQDHVALFSVYWRRGLQRRPAASMLLYVIAAGWLFAAVPLVLSGQLSALGSLLYLGPVVTVMVAAVVLKEPITVASIAGGAVIVGGVWVATRAGR